MQAGRPMRDRLGFANARMTDEACNIYRKPSEISQKGRDRQGFKMSHAREKLRLLSEAREKILKR